MKANYPTLAIALALVIFAVARASAPTMNATDTASVKGTVKLIGTPPAPTRINMSSDPVCAQQHSTPVYTEDVVTDKNGDLENVVVFVTNSLGDRTFDVPAQPVVINQKGCVYQPHVVALQANQKVQIINHDACTHNIHPVSVNNREWNQAQAGGSSMEVTFPREEVGLPLKCNVHPWMRGYLSVFKHPYFAVTGKDGSFDISNLPPGTYTIEAWQEKLGTSTQTVTIGGNETKTVQFVFKAR